MDFYRLFNITNAFIQEVLLSVQLVKMKTQDKFLGDVLASEHLVLLEGDAIVLHPPVVP